MTGTSTSGLMTVAKAAPELIPKTAMAITKLKTRPLKQQQRNTNDSQDKPEGIFFPTDQVGDGNGKNCPCLPADFVCGDIHEVFLPFSLDILRKLKRLCSIRLSFAYNKFAFEIPFTYIFCFFICPFFQTNFFDPAKIEDLHIVRITVGLIRRRRKIQTRELKAVAA
jgi:hypothetical protein